MAGHLVVFGLGFTGAAAARLAAAQGWTVTGTSRTPETFPELPGVQVVHFDQVGRALASATHVLATAAPGEAGDPVLARHGRTLAKAGDLRWVGYLSTTGVYGDRGGAWVDEDTLPAPSAPRGQRRLDAEEAWRRTAASRSLDLFRLAGIYGPGRSALDDLRAGRARRVLRPGHLFGRIHRDDVAGAVLAAMACPPSGTRVLNGADNEPAEQSAVIEEAARLLGMAPPPAVPYDEAVQGMSEMARSFWAESRRVGSARTQEALGRRWLYPSYREGLRAILAAERGEKLPDRPADQVQVARP